MKTIIRLTESDLRNIISKSVKKVVSEAINVRRRGYVSNDGNGMVGGEYGSYSEYGTKNVMNNLLEDIPIDSDNGFDEFEAYCEQNEDAFEITAKINFSYDESTGYGSSYFPVGEIESIDSDNAVECLRKYPDVKISQLAIQTLQNIIDGLDDGDFEINSEY